MHVIVTGASSGIGEALVREYAAAGASVTLVARRTELLEKIAKELGGTTRVVAADLGEPIAGTAWLPAAVAALGPCDILINNAGVQIVKAAVDTDPDKGEQLLRLNVHSPMRLTVAVLPAMLARKSGCIIDVASMAAITPTPGMYYYNASKAALAAASESLRDELRGTGVHVLTVYPGPVHTAMGDAGITNYEKTTASRLVPWGTTEELARIVRRAAEKKRPRVIYPRSYALTRYFPNLSRWFVGRFTPRLKAPDGERTP